MSCKICGENDLFTEVTNSLCCSVCTVNFMGGLPQTDARVAAIREKLGLTDGDLLQQDNAAEAAHILLGRQRK